MDWPEARALFPSLQKRVYLNTAGGGPLSERSAAAGRAYYEQSLADGDVHWDAWLEQVEAARGRLAAFLNTTPESIGFTANASTGLNAAAHMLDGAGAVLAVAEEFPSCTLPFLQRGLEVDFLDGAPDGSVDLAAVEGAVDERTGVLLASSVQFRSGYRHDLAALGALCREHDLAFVVDATQGIGAFPIDVAAAGIDFLAFSAYKWATSGYSIGAVCIGERYRRPSAYPLVGWRSAERPYDLAHDRLEITADARALEQGHPPFAGVFALAASLELIDEIGIDRIADRIIELTLYLHERLEQAGIGVLSTRDPAHVSGITVADVERPQETVVRLRGQGIVVSSRGEGIRISVHYFNNRNDIDRLVASLTP